MILFGVIVVTAALYVALPIALGWLIISVLRIKPGLFRLVVYIAVFIVVLDHWDGVKERWKQQNDWLSAPPSAPASASGGVVAPRRG